MSEMQVKKNTNGFGSVVRLGDRVYETQEEDEDEDNESESEEADEDSEDEITAEEWKKRYYDMKAAKKWYKWCHKTMWGKHTLSEGRLKDALRNVDLLKKKLQEGRLERSRMEERHNILKAENKWLEEKTAKVKAKKNEMIRRAIV